MIKISLGWAIALFLILMLGGVFILWIFYAFAQKQEGPTEENIAALIQCPYCTNMFCPNIKTNPVIRCPKFKRYIDALKDLPS